jgi:lysozyme
MAQKHLMLKYWKSFYTSLLICQLVFVPIYVSDGQSVTFKGKVDFQSPLENYIGGIDISKHNGAVDWEELEAHRKTENYPHFVFIKATEGSDFKDVLFEENWEQSREHNFVRGAYHFFSLNSDPKKQAEYYLKIVDFQTQDFLPILDFETTSGSHKSSQRIAADVKIWLETVEGRLGVKPIIYTNTPMYKRIVKKYFPDYPLWISDYDSPNIKDFDSKELLIWQYSQSGRVKGIQGAVDLNVFIGTPHKFQKYHLKENNN